MFRTGKYVKRHHEVPLVAQGFTQKTVEKAEKKVEEKEQKLTEEETRVARQKLFKGWRKFSQL